MQESVKSKNKTITLIISANFIGILSGEPEAVVTYTRVALENGLTAQEILDDGMIATIAEVGVLFECGEFYLPEMLISARTMQAGLGVLRPHLPSTNVKATSRVRLNSNS